MTNEWESFKVGTPSSIAGGENPTCRPFDTVMHVTHVRPAQRIVEDRRIIPLLVRDKSKLTDKRIQIVWFSPNDWYQGSIYGVIEFSFDWKEVIENMHAYWVESMAYGVTACRILLTEKEYSDPSWGLVKFDPEKPTGPWWFDKKTKTHYRNGNVNLEFMVENQISLGDARSFRTVKHRPSICSLNKGNADACVDHQLRSDKIGGTFLATLVSTGTKINKAPFVINDEGHVKPEEETTRAWESLLNVIYRDDSKFTGSTVYTDAVAGPLARAVMGAVAIRKPDEVTRLVGLFKTKRDLFARCSFAISWG